MDTPLFAALKNAVTESPELAGGNVKLTACYYVGPAPSKADKRLIAQDTVMVRTTALANGVCAEQPNGSAHACALPSHRCSLTWSPTPTPPTLVCTTLWTNTW